ncbi:F-Box/Wd Repeat-Containing Protein 2 [Manis pentadactyla]|nr:F-Box/Wd Repeat-Containing Protein 2 [Manis pentadactyla]
MTDVEADGVISETLALRKELGSGSDVTGRARWWIRFMGECMIEFEDKAEIWVTSKMKVKCQILAPGPGIALVVRKDKFRIKLKCQILAPGLGLALVGECAIQFQDYSEARVISMMTVEFQATVRR